MRFNWKTIRNTALGAFLVISGIISALVTLLANHVRNPELAGYASIAALLIVALIMIFVVPPLMKSARLELLMLDFPLQVTKGGLIFLMIISIVAFAAWNTGNNLLFLILSVLFSTLFVAWAAARVSLRDLVVSARFPDHIFAGEPASVIINVKNKKRFWPTFSLLVEARNRISEKQEINKRRFTSDKRILGYFMYVPRRSTIEQHVEHVFEKRGHMFITGLELSTSFPFGFFKYRRRLRTRNVDLAIYPQLELVDEALQPSPTNAGRLNSLRSGLGNELFLLRDYQLPDDPRYIDWKATARARQLIVREFTADEERRVHIIFDSMVPPGTDNQEFALRFEKGVTLAASLISYFINMNVEICLTIDQNTDHYGNGRDHLYKCLRRLAYVEPTPSSVNSELHISGLESISKYIRTKGSSYMVLITSAPAKSFDSNSLSKIYLLNF
jgi:uncharacterized protein (DUF58 family)